jgi:hypothetical protein
MKKYIHILRHIGVVCFPGSDAQPGHGLQLPMFDSLDSFIGLAYMGFKACMAWLLENEFRSCFLGYLSYCHPY